MRRREAKNKPSKISLDIIHLKIEIEILLWEDPVRSRAFPMKGRPVGPGSFAASSYIRLRDKRQ